jgi:plasmid stabilization system protein ParE
MIVFSPDAITDIERLRAFLDEANPRSARRAVAAILMAIEGLQELPERGMPTEDAGIRQIIVRFGTSGYIVRYAILTRSSNILITRIWHGREARS